MAKRRKARVVDLVDGKKAKDIVGAPKGINPFSKPKRLKKSSPLLGNSRRTYYIR